MRAVSRPLQVTVPPHGVVFAESEHAADFRMPVRADPFHKLVYVLRGDVVCRDHAARREFAAGAGTLFTIDRGTPHQLRDQTPAVLLLLCFAPRFIDADVPRRTLWAALGAQRVWRVPAGRPSSQRFENLWRRALLEQSAEQAGAIVALHALAGQILVTLARWPAAGAKADTPARRIQAVAQEVAESFYDEWTLDRAAARAGLSRRRFSELFRAHTGATFLETLTTLRLAHAARLLRAGAHSVTGVAFSCGYRDVSHFYRAFRARYGRPPGEWRQKRLS